MKTLIRGLAFCLLLSPLELRAAGPANAQTIWRLLDYVAVDYPNAVRAGSVVTASEYAEMQDFAGTLQREIAALRPLKPQQADLTKGAHALTAAITNKADGAVVAALARQLATELLSAYPVPLAPSTPPNLARGASLYAAQCSGCHGTMGNS